MRTFIAIDIAKIDEIVNFQNYIIDRYNFDSRYARPTKKDHLHITMKFLGEKDEGEIQNIITSLKNLCFHPFSIRFNKVGCFPNVRFPKIIWIGLDDQSNQNLDELYHKISDVLKIVGDMIIKKENNDVHALKTEETEKKYSVSTTRDSTSSSFDDRKFFPHLTIFRVKPHYKIPDFYSSFSDTTICNDVVNRISIKQSVLTSDGPIYSDLFYINASKKNEN